MPTNLASILIPVFNNLKFLQYLIQTLQQHTRKQDYELILVDNHSTEPGFAAYYRKIQAANIKIIQNDSNLGFGRANNIGLQHSQGELIVLLNTDMYFSQSWLPHLQQRIQVANDCAAVHAKLIVPLESAPNTWKTQTCGAKFDARGLPQYYLDGYPANAPEVNKACEVHALMGAGVAIKRAVIEEVGFFDEEYDLVFMEDTDLSLRISEKGYRIYYEPRALIYHFHSASMPHLSQADYDRSRLANLARFQQKWPAAKVKTIMQGLGIEIENSKS